MDCFELKYKKPIPTRKYLVQKQVDVTMSRVVHHLVALGYSEESAKDVLNHIAAKFAQHGWDF